MGTKVFRLVIAMSGTRADGPVRLMANGHVIMSYPGGTSQVEDNVEKIAQEFLKTKRRITGTIPLGPGESLLLTEHI